MRQQPSCCKFLQLSPCKSQQWLYEKWSWNGILKRMYYWSTGSLSLNTTLSNVLYIEDATFIAWALGQVQYVWNALEGVPHFCPLPLGSECSGLFLWSHIVTFMKPCSLLLFDIRQLRVEGVTFCNPSLCRLRCILFCGMPGSFYGKTVMGYWGGSERAPPSALCDWKCNVAMLVCM